MFIIKLYIHTYTHTHTDAHTHFVSLIWHTIKKNRPLEATETQK